MNKRAPFPGGSLLCYRKQAAPHGQKRSIKRYFSFTAARLGATMYIVEIYRRTEADIADMKERLMEHRLIPVLLGAVLLLSACADKSPAATPAPDGAPTPTVSASAAPTPTPELSGPPVWGEQVSDCQRVNDAGVVLVEGRFALPYIENAGTSAAYAAVNDWYLDLSAGLRSDTLANESLAADDYAVSAATGDPFTGYYDEETYRIEYESARLVNILRTHYGYTGGVYPSLFYLSDRFDLTTGSVLAFGDFFTDPDAARELVLAEIGRQAAEREELAALPAETLRETFRQEDFYLSEGGLIFYYQPGLLGPHAADAPKFTIPLSLLGELYISHD